MNFIHNLTKYNFIIQIILVIIVIIMLFIPNINSIFILGKILPALLLSAIPIIILTYWIINFNKLSKDWSILIINFNKLSKDWSILIINLLLLILNFDFVFKFLNIWPLFYVFSSIFLLLIIFVRYYLKNRKINL